MEFAEFRPAAVLDIDANSDQGVQKCRQGESNPAGHSLDSNLESKSSDNRRFRGCRRYTWFSLNKVEKADAEVCHLGGQERAKNAAQAQPITGIHRPGTDLGVTR